MYNGGDDYIYASMKPMMDKFWDSAYSGMSEYEISKIYTKKTKTLSADPYSIEALDEELQECQFDISMLYLEYEKSKKDGVDYLGKIEKLSERVRELKKQISEREKDEWEKLNDPVAYETRKRLEKYDYLISEFKSAQSEYDYRILHDAFGELESFMDAQRYANVCGERYLEIKLGREAQTYDDAMRRLGALEQADKRGDADYYSTTRDAEDHYNAKPGAEDHYNAKHGVDEYYGAKRGAVAHYSSKRGAVDHYSAAREYGALAGIFNEISDYSDALEMSRYCADARDMANKKGDRATKISGWVNIVALTFGYLTQILATLLYAVVLLDICRPGPIGSLLSFFESALYAAAFHGIVDASRRFLFVAGNLWFMLIAFGIYAIIIGIINFLLIRPTIRYAARPIAAHSGRGFIYAAIVAHAVVYAILMNAAAVYSFPVLRFIWNVLSYSVLALIMAIPGILLTRKPTSDRAFSFKAIYIPATVFTMFLGLGAIYLSSMFSLAAPPPVYAPVAALATDEMEPALADLPQGQDGDTEIMDLSDDDVLPAGPA
ncbi:MAG: hypothetical protein FWH01_09175, partial [Oscillospiraceae bacterium]|nr:hypothetical protein [Oscillospiraceae bacterium]